MNSGAPRILLAAFVPAHFRAFHLPWVDRLREFGCEVHGAADRITEMPECVAAFKEIHDVPFSRNPHRSQRLGHRVFMDDIGEHLDRFITLYLDTMRRPNADAEYKGAGVDRLRSRLSRSVPMSRKDLPFKRIQLHMDARCQSAMSTARRRRVAGVDCSLTVSVV
jgi:hypothetical protein